MISAINTSLTATRAATSPISVFCSSNPLANRLAKLTTLPFGRTKWQNRFFILFDSEIRIYKDEFADTPCDILNLDRIKTTLPLAIGPQSHCLRLEPHMPHEKSLTLACPSQHDCDAWSNAIHLRLEKIKQAIQQSTDASKPSTPSLSRRRGIVLAPLTIWNDSGLAMDDREDDDDDDEITVTSVQGFSSASALFCSSSTPPSSYVYQRSMSVSTVITSSPSSSGEQDGETSPSFLKYKQQFRLY